MIDPREFEDLTEAQEEVLRKQRLRQQYVFEQVQAGRSQSDIARELGTARQHVNEWLARARKA